MVPSMRRILCVDDNKDACRMLSVMLNLSGFEVVSAETVAEGLDLAQSRRFDLYLLDVWLPDGSGIDLCRQIRQHDRDTPIIFYTAADYEVYRRRGLEAGAQVFLIKPRDLEVLIETVTRLIEAGATKDAGGGAD